MGETKGKSIGLPGRLLALTPVEEVLLSTFQSGEATTKQTYERTGREIREATVRVYVIGLHRKKLITRLRKIAELSSDRVVLGKVNVYSISPLGKAILAAWTTYRKTLESTFIVSNHKDV